VTVSKDFTDKFKKENLESVYFLKIKYGSGVGIDRVNRLSFESRLAEYVETIERKTQNGTYKFTPYKEKLIVKGANSLPRTVSIPTIRDKVTLKVLSELITDSFKNDVSTKLVQTIIADLKTSIDSNNYDYFLRFDIKNFFPTINHEILIRKLKKRIRKTEVITLIRKAIETPTVPMAQARVIKTNTLGVPQGLSISNILANIYLSKLDSLHNQATSYKYYRYVDDLLIICEEKDAPDIKKTVIKEIQKGLSLTMNYSADKTNEGKLIEGFTFLGYSKNPKGFTVRDSSIKKLEESIMGLFTEYKYSKWKNVNLLLWKLDLRITGCKLDGKKYGWLFFFSQINDLDLLFYLDWFVLKASLRFEPKDLLFTQRPKKFIRTYHEIVKNLSNTNYIPDYGEYTLEMKEHLLKNIFKFDVLTEKEITETFHKVISSSIKDLEKDIQSISM